MLLPIRLSVSANTSEGKMACRSVRAIKPAVSSAVSCQRSFRLICAISALESRITIGLLMPLGGGTRHHGSSQDLQVLRFQARSACGALLLRCASVFGLL